jgi:hypothetical protein
LQHAEEAKKKAEEARLKVSVRLCCFAPIESIQREREAAERRRELDEKAAAEVKAERAVC